MLNDFPKIKWPIRGAAGGMRQIRRIVCNPLKSVEITMQRNVDSYNMLDHRLN